MTAWIAKRRGAIAVATAVATAGLLLHNVYEFPLSILISIETLGPLAVTVVLLAIVCVRPERFALIVLTVWIGMHMILGGASVLPLPGLPFEPEQTVTHYVVHVLYAILQLPMFLLGWRLLRRPGRANSVTSRRVL